MVLTIVFGVVGFGLIVFVHEFGHFVAAKLSGITVEVFSLGWGKKLVGFIHKGTQYQISWFPVGGYCKMKGEESIVEALSTKGGRIQPEEGSFYSVTPLKRVLVSAGGPLGNLIFSVLVLSVIFLAGYTVFSDRNKVILMSDYSVDVAPEILPAEEAGLKTGDRITAIDGRIVEKFNDILEIVATSPQERLLFSVERNGELFELAIVPDLDQETGTGRIGVYAWTDPVVDRIIPDKAGMRAGLRSGDRIVEIGRRGVDHTIDIFQALQDKPDLVEISYVRENQRYAAQLLLSYSDEGFPDLGIVFKQYKYRSPKVSLPAAFLLGIGETYETMRLTVKGFGLLFKGVNIGKAIAGPLRITYYVGASATSSFSRGFGTGIVNFFRFLCLLSVVLFIMNLLPIPALDGGRIILHLIELLMGRPVNSKIVYRIQMFSFYVLILLVIVITFNDILFFIEG